MAEKIFFFLAQHMNDFICGFNRAIYFCRCQAVQIDIDSLISFEIPYSASIGLLELLDYIRSENFHVRSRVM